MNACRKRTSALDPDAHTVASMTVVGAASASTGAASTWPSARTAVIFHVPTEIVSSPAAKLSSTLSPTTGTTSCPIRIVTSWPRTSVTLPGTPELAAPGTATSGPSRNPSPRDEAKCASIPTCGSFPKLSMRTACTSVP